MPKIHLPEANRSQVVIEPDGEHTVLDIDPALIIDLYKAHGALLLRGFGADVAQFRAFARRFCATAVINESPGRRAIDADATIFSVDGGTGAFALHPELSREPWKPDAAFFACLSPPSRGGATTICDGVALARALPVDLRRALAPRRLLYIMATWPELLDFWLGDPDPSDAMLAAPVPSTCPYSFRRIDGQVVRFFTRPVLHKPMFSAEPAFGNFLLFARFTRMRFDFPLLDDGQPVPEAWLQAIKAVGDALTVAVAWQAGDLLMLDNTRFMHGRTPIVDASERLIATFFGYVGFALPNAEEPVDPPWRHADFAPPLPPGFPR
jgi:alpha-ketoglutarate-dependent taurine dioxygenase